MGSVKDILAAVYLAGTENGLSRRLTDPEEIMHRKEAFIKGNPACKEAEAELNQHYLKVFMDLIGEDFDIPNISKDWDALRAANAVKKQQRQQAKKLLGESDE